MATEKKTPKTKERKEKAPATREAAPQKQEQVKAPAQVDTRNSLQRRRMIVGTVVSDKMQKTIVVSVESRIRHRRYQKYLTKSTRYKAHDERNEAKVGDLVRLVESRPLSREKRWVLQSIIRRAGQAPEINV